MPHSTGNPRLIYTASDTSWMTRAWLAQAALTIEPTREKPGGYFVYTFRWKDGVVKNGITRNKTRLSHFRNRKGSLLRIEYFSNGMLDEALARETQLVNLAIIIAPSGDCWSRDLRTHLGNTEGGKSECRIMTDAQAALLVAVS